MTLVNIITNALIALGRTTDAQSMEAWKDKLTMFCNDGIADIANYLHLRKTEEIDCPDGVLDVTKLSCDCTKVISVKKDGSDISFDLGDKSDEIKLGTSGVVAVEYRYIPIVISNDIDEPGIPRNLHHLLVPYIVYCEHLSNSPNMQRRADAFFSKYQDGLRQARKDYGEEDTYDITNVEWI